MSGTPDGTAAGAGGSRRWFVILAVVTLIVFAIFVGAVTVLSMRIPELKKPRYGVLENGSGGRRS
jgi:hypothetical protein